MTKKTKWVILVILLCIVVLFGICIIRNANYVKQGEIKDYVKDNTDSLTEFANQLLNNQQKSIVVYDKRYEYPTDANSRNIYKHLRIDDMAVYKKFHDEPNRVKIYLKNKPMSSDYYACGIYYSPDDTTIDYYGEPQSDATYVYDGTPQKTRIRYKSEKICDNWYYFEEAVWN